MTHRPTTARSEISSAISDDGISSAPQSGIFIQQQQSASPSPHGYAHLRGITPPVNRMTRSPAPGLGSSRPNSPENQLSRTHIPSITAQGFLRPLSSARLQQQRLERQKAGGRSSSAATDRPPTSSTRPDIDDTRSVKSNHTGPVASLPRSHRQAPSVTTGYAESESAEPALTALQNENRRAFDAVFNNLPGQNRTNNIPTPLNLNSGLHVGSIRGDQSSIRSPGTFRSGFSIRSKHIFEPGHQQLPSTGTSPHFDERQEKQIAQDSAKAKNYEYFEGNKKFFLGGRIQNTRDRPVNIFTGFVLVLPTILFFVYSASYLWNHVSRAIPFFFAYLFFICFSSFVHGSLVDPGIYPRNIHDVPPRHDEYKDPLEVEKHVDWVMVRLATSQAEAMDVPVKDCKTCNIWRPPRCYHCRVCNSCVDTLDHHCVWLNNCVGRRNYRYFFAFVSSGTLLGFLLAFGSLGHVISYSKREHISVAASININRVPFAMFIYGLLGAGYPVALWGYHLMLMAKGQTTREYLASRRFVQSERYKPFNLGNFFKNWVAVLARPKPPTYMHFKKEYEQGDQRLGRYRNGIVRPQTEEGKSGGLEMTPVSGQKQRAEAR